MSQYTPEAVEAMADNLAGYLNTPAAPMLRAYAATLRQAARVDEGEVQRALDSWYDIEGGIHGDELRERMRAALEAALSAQPLIHESGAMSSESGQPAERQGEAVASLRIFDAATDGIPSYALGRLPAMDRLPVGEYRLHLHSAAPVGVPDGAVDTRDHFGPPCVAVVFDTQENANKYRDKLTEAMQLRQNLAAATPAPQGVDRG